MEVKEWVRGNLIFDFLLSKIDSFGSLDTHGQDPWMDGGDSHKEGML